jgi:hypothetical protein
MKKLLAGGIALVALVGGPALAADMSVVRTKVPKGLLPGSKMTLLALIHCRATAAARRHGVFQTYSRWRPFVHVPASHWTTFCHT